MALNVLSVYGIDNANTQISFKPLEAAVSSLKNGQFDATFLVLSPDNSLVLDLAQDSDLQIFDFQHTNALTRRLANTDEVTVPQGTFDLMKNLPSHDLKLVGVPNTVIFRSDLNPELVYVLLDVMRETHASANIMSNANQFPTRSNQALEESNTVKEYYARGLPWASRQLPYWLSAIIN